MGEKVKEISDICYVKNRITHETMTLGPSSLYKEYIGRDEIYIEAHENYQKRSYRNRYFISGPNGIIQLTVPLVKGKNHRTPIRDVRISYDIRWIHQHLHTIKSCYGSSPYYIHYENLIGEIFKRKHEFLIDLNQSMLQCTLNIIGLNLKTGFTNSYQRKYSDGDYRNVFGIKKRLGSKVTYPQVFEEKFGFIGGLSILDLIFCTGPESKLYLSRMKKYDN